MKKFIKLLFVLAIFCSIVSYDSFAKAVPENSNFTLQVKDKLINLQAENADFKEILKDLDAKTGIKVKIYKGVKDKEVSMNIKSLPVYAVGAILDKMLLNNFAVVYDDQLTSVVVYVLPEGKDISEVTKGKSIIRHEDFAGGNTIDVSAPGINIISTGLDNSYIYASGTSASVPMVSCLAAMLVLEKPDLSSSFIERLIIQSAKDFGEKGWDRLYGEGEIDANAALQHYVELFHDVAIGSMNMDSMAVSENDHIFVLIELQNRGSFDREEVSLKLWLNDEIRLDEVKITLMGDKIIAVDAGLLTKKTECLLFRAEIAGAADDINPDNNSKIIKYQIKRTRGSSG